MILLRDDASAERFKEDLSAFVTQLWDIGLDVGHSVRTLKQCAELADSDITIATNLMESRTICGDPSLTEEMQKVTGPEHIWDAKAFFMAKWKGIKNLFCWQCKIQNNFLSLLLPVNLLL